VEIGVAGKLRSDRSHKEKYRMGVVPKSGEASKQVVREATTDVLMKLGLYGIQVKIAIKNAVPPMVEFIEQPPEAPPQPKEVKVEEPKKEEAARPEPKAKAPKAKAAKEKAPKAPKADAAKPEERAEKVEEKAEAKVEEDVEAKPEDNVEAVTPAAVEAPEPTEKVEVTEQVEQIAKSESEES
jgi:ribosomal protein S3